MAVRRQLRDRAPSDEVHDERGFGLIDDRVTHGHDIRMADGLHRGGFAPEPLAGAFVGDQVRVKALDRDDLARALVVGTPDRRHAAHGVRFEQAVTAPQQTSVHRLCL